MLKKSLLLLFVIAVLLPSATLRAQAPAATVSTQIVVQRGAAMKTRDGVTLRQISTGPPPKASFPFC